jgi:hypothetical protein
MKVEVDINVICPECGCVMTRFADHVSCQTTSCENYNKEFEKPKIALHEVGEETGGFLLVGMEPSEVKQFEEALKKIWAERKLCVSLMQSGNE